EMDERALRLVVHQVRVRRRRLLALRHEREHRLLALDGALLAREAGDVASRRAIRALRVDEGALALVRAKVAGRALVVLRRVLEIESGLDADEPRRPRALVAPQRLDRRAERAGLAGVR